MQPVWKDWKSCMKTEKEKKCFPLFMDLTEKKAVVFGAGAIGTRRILALLPYVGSLTVVALQAGEEIQKLAMEKQIRYYPRGYQREDLYDADLVLAATGDPAVDGDIYSGCKCLGILVNVASDQKKCDFHFPGLLEYDGVTIGFNGGGKDHRKVKQTRQKVQQALETDREGETEA